MADTPRQNHSTYGGKPPPAAKPRVSGHLPWDQSHTPRVRSKPSQRPPAQTPNTVAGDVRHSDETFKTSFEDSVLSEENALLEELDEVLSSTTGSKSSKSTAESRVSDSGSTPGEVLEEELQTLEESVYQGGTNQKEQLQLTAKEIEAEGEKVVEEEMWAQDGVVLGVTGQGYGPPENGEKEARAPRYAGRKFNTYEEMLDNMDSDDPYSKEPPPSDKKPPTARSKYKPKASKIPAKSSVKQSNNTANSAKNERANSQRQAPAKRTNNKSKNNKTSVAADVGNGYENPAYAENGRSRRNSTDSNRTYVLGASDSRAALIDEKNTPYIKDSKGGGEERRLSAVVAPCLGLEPCFVFDSQSTEKDFIEVSGRRFIQDHIQHRKCSTYISSGEKQDVCGCGLKKGAHGYIPTPSPPGKNVKWSVDEHTQLIEADTYGTIAFQGFGQEMTEGAPYVRVDEKMRHKNLKHLWLLLSEVWKLPPPKMIVSVTGGAKRFFMKNRIRKSFQRGLINVASSSGAWIVTGGTGTGVMQFVGEAVREYQLAGGCNRQPIVALGITTWGTVDNKEALISADKNGLSPASYHMDCLSYAKRTAPLDPNHTHFILVDDGTTAKFGREIKFRAALERFISDTGLIGLSQTQSFSQSKESSQDSVTHVPVVLLVLEGGTNTLQTTLEAIKEGTPIVVIQGSGRAADMIALGYKETKSDPKLDIELQKDRAFEMFDWSRATPEDRDAEIDKCVEYLREILSKKYRHLMTVFHIDDVDTTKEIDEAILQALLKAEGSKVESQLNLAIAWNRCDIARQQIFDYGSGNRIGKIGKSHMEAAMMTALLQDSSDFVQLFLDHGFDMTSFLTKRTLRALYDEILGGMNVNQATGLLKRQLLQAEGIWVPVYSNFRRQLWQAGQDSTLRNVGSVINSLLGDYSENLYAGSEFIISPSGISKGVKAVKASLSAAERGKVVGETPAEAKSLQSNTPKSNQGTAERDLFLWSVLLNRQKLAHVFWKAGKDHIGGALIASSLLRSLGDYARVEEENDLAQELYQAAGQWEEIAVGVLNECYLQDKEMAHELLVRDIETWGGSTLLVISDTAEQMDFMGHSCCQTKLNKIWKGKMALYTSSWKILMCMFMPIFLPTIRFYTGEFAAMFQPDVKVSISSSKLHLGSKNKIGESAGYLNDSGAYTSGGSSGGGDIGETMTTSTSFMKIIGHIYYYHTAPITKFTYHVLSYLVFLALFSYVILTDLHPVNEKPPSTVEYVVWGWAATLLIEEFRQMATRSPTRIMRKLAGYFDSVWNRYDLLMNIMFIITIILRYTLTGDNFIWARTFYSLTMAMHYLRLMQFFYVEKNVGPKVIMIRRMLTDLSFFVAIMMTVILAYGVAAQSLQYPNSPLQLSLLKDVLYKPYWNIYGELFLEDFEGKTDGCSSDENLWKNATANVSRCPQQSWLAAVLFAIYMILTNILLLNLLIAMFSYTFQSVQDNAEKVWRYFRYSLVYEYYDKPTLAPPLIIFTHMWRVLKYFFIRCKVPLSYESDFRKKMHKQKCAAFTAFERAGMENYLLKQNKTSREHIDAKVHSASERIEKVIEDLEAIKEQVSSPGVSKELDQTISLLSSRNPEKFVVPRTLDFKDTKGRMDKLESKITEQGELLHKMMSYMEDMHKNRPAVRESSSKVQKGWTDETDKEPALLDHVTSLQGQINEHAYVMEKLMTIIEDMSSGRSETGKQVSPSQVNYATQQSQPSTPGGSISGIASYRKRTFVRDPTIEIQDIPGDSSAP